MDFKSKFEYWKNSLLDLGKRNKLINYKETKRSTITITYPDMYVLWDKIVNNEETITFPFLSEYFNEEDDDEDEEDDYDDFADGDIKTNQTVKELQKTLRNIKSKAKISKEELGINTLYVGFGFLKWKESENSAFELSSPLVLVPIEIELEDLNSPYTFSILQGEDIIINPALAYKLDYEYGIDINYDLTDNLKEYIEFVNNKIKNTKWKIEEKTSCSLMSFYKISMYNDLILNKEKIEQSPIMQLIMGNNDYSQDIPDELNNINFDKEIKVRDSFQIMDADSSQLEAIEYAKKGISFVLQGPPGTGKSQTITNMIAELLAQGKKVLFVSSKMAALEVVYNRMQKAHLEKFCLSLHDPKTNKKVILQQLDDVLRIGNANYKINEQANYNLEKLQILKDKLNEYSKELHEVRKPFNKSIYQINGEISKLDNIEELIFDFNNIENIDQEQFNKIIYSLEEYTRTIGQSTDYWKTNCWNNVKKLELNNDIRYNIGYYLNDLCYQLNNFNKELAEKQKILNINLNITKANYKKVIELLIAIEELNNIPITWFSKNDLFKLYDKAMIQKEIVDNIKREQNTVNEIISNEKFFNIKDNVDENISMLTDYKNSDEIYTKLDTISTEELQELLNKLNVYLIEYNKLKDSLLENYEKGILEIEYKEILNRFKSEYNTPFKAFNKNYKNDKKKFEILKKEIQRKINDNEIIQTLYLLESIDKLKEDNIEVENIWKNIFGKYYNNFDTNIEQINDKIRKHESLLKIEKLFIHIKELNEKKLDIDELKDFVTVESETANVNWDEVLQKISNLMSLNEKCNILNIDKVIILALYNNKNKNNEVMDLINLININYTNIDNKLNWVNSLFENTENIANITSSKLLEKFSQCLNSMDMLEKYLDYKTAKEKCISLGLGSFINIIEKENASSNKIISLFKKRFYGLWLDFVEHDCKGIIEFRKEKHENDISEFRKLDKEQYKTNQYRILSRIVNGFPNLNRFANGDDEISILKRELNKKRKNMSLRRLFKNIPKLILTLKPCLMMSPLSVSIFLNSEEYMFDTIIFDEASQVKTEEAIGAIIRGKQAIIVGDNKQLPPTSFFNATTTEFEEDIEEYDDTGAYESILDEATLLPEKTLLWHYRSKNESLIAFSNAKFYSNRLITFPSKAENIPNNGVEFYYVEDGRYDRGGKKGNVIEAKKVAELVFKHFKENPDRSLGVIAFGEIQQYAIENEINRIRAENPLFEKFFLEDNEEAFFVKNLENVQGDERDTIIFSIGYAKDLNGNMNMNFGPLSRIGGERRLNVAITRAKYNVKLVSSIQPNDIDIDRINSEGAKLLKKYIEFAKNGISVLQNEITVNDTNFFDSPFEESVYNFLVNKGYDVSTQVGCSSYRIDMAIKKPSNKELYTIGIECDGATYHSSRTARERDRLRQDVLESMGWKIYRIWSTDWIKNRNKEETDLLKAIEKSMEVIDNTNINEKKNQEKIGDYIEITKKDTENPYELEYYKEYDFQYDKFKNYPIKKILEDVIQTEYPIHFDEICKRVAMYYLSLSAGKKVKENVRLELLQMKDRYIVDEDFYMPKDMEIKPRCNLMYNNSYGQKYIYIGDRIFDNYEKDNMYLKRKRPIKYIYVKELALIMKKIEEKSIDIDKQSLYEETAKVLNIRVSSSYYELERAYNILNKL